MASYDIITLGETMLRLTPSNFKRLEQTTRFDVEVGGSESNTAVGLARLGLKTAWLSRLPQNPLGKLVASSVAKHGVDISHLAWADGERLGLYFLEEGHPPRGSRIIYDRQLSAFSRIQPSDLVTDLFHQDGARLLHLTGITPALSPSAADTALQAARLAQAAGWVISFDLNYRSQLWSPEAAQTGCEPFIQTAHIFFLSLRDARLIYRLDPQLAPEATLRNLANRYPETTIILTLGKDGAIGYESMGKMQRQAAFQAMEVGRIGGGDAFAAGFLYGYLSADAPATRLAAGLRWGAAMAAIKYTVPGDMPVIEKQEVEQLAANGSEAESQLKR